MNYNETPMRPEYKINDPKRVELIKNIFIRIDQAWTDTAAFEVNQLIDEYVDGLEKFGYDARDTPTDFGN